MSVSVLMYHHVLPKSGFITSSVEEFEAQMRFLATNGYNTLTSDEFYAYKKGELNPPKNSVLITFDDGWRDNFYYAYPVLKKFGLKATLFLVTSWIEEASKKHATFTPLSHSKAKFQAPNNPSGLFLNWDEVHKMSDVFDFHSHTHSHTDGYFGEIGFEKDLEICKNTIKARLGIDDIQLCWPRGEYDEKRLKFAKSIGYELFYTTKRGVNLPLRQLDDIRRIAAKKDEIWLKKTLFIYQNDILGALYAKLKKS